MDPTLRALLTTWEWRPEVILVLGAAGAFYLRGWLRLRRRGRQQIASGWRLASYMGGLLVLALSLMSAIDILGGLLFLMHMLQHLLMLMVAPVLLLLGNPFPFIIWGLPRGRQIGYALLSRQAPLRRLLRQLPPAGTLILSVAFLWGWHDPSLYNGALRHGWLHDLQHLTFFLPGLLFWWKVMGAAPHVHGRVTPLTRIALLLVLAIANAIPGVIIAMSPEPIYSYYLEVPRLWGISALQDQMIGGILMWIPGTMMYLLALLIIVGRQLGHPENRPLAVSEHLVSQEWR
jgi:putative membrane protein